MPAFGHAETLGALLVASILGFLIRDDAVIDDLPRSCVERGRAGVCADLPVV